MAEAQKSKEKVTTGVEYVKQSYGEWLADMKKRDEHYKFFCKCQRELSDNVKELAVDMEKLGRRFLASQQETKLQAALLEEARLEVIELNKQFLEQECVVRMLAESDGYEFKVEELDIEKILKEIEETYGTLEVAQQATANDAS